MKIQLQFYGAASAKAKTGFYGQIDGDPANSTWTLTIMRELNGGGFEQIFNSDYKDLFHAKTALRNFRKGLKWVEVPKKVVK